MSEWQPIETAPKDGTQIIAFEIVPVSALLHMPNPKDTPHVFMAYWWKGNDLSKPRWWGGLTGNPTHWIPLPDPPLDTR